MWWPLCSLLSTKSKQQEALGPAYVQRRSNTTESIAEAEQFFFFSNQTNALFPDVSSDCNLALTAPIPQCPGEVLSLLSNSDYYTLGNDTVMDTLCAEGCPAAFATYRSNVTAACVNDPQPEPGYPATYYVDAATSMFTQACLKDSQTGMYCTGTDFRCTNPSRRY